MVHIVFRYPFYMELRSMLLDSSLVNSDCREELKFRRLLTNEKLPAPTAKFSSEISTKLNWRETLPESMS